MAKDLNSGKFVYHGSPRVGLNNVGSYQVSGIPFITGSNGSLPGDYEARIKFPYVSRSVTVINSGSGGPLLVHFNSSSDGDVTSDKSHHYVTLASDQTSMTFDVKCKEIFITSKGAGTGFELFAELTNIPTGSMYTLTGSGLTNFSDESNPG